MGRGAVRWRDPLVPPGDVGVDRTAAIETGPTAAEIDAGAGGRGVCYDRPLRRRYHRILAALRRIIDPARVIVWVAGDRYRSSGGWECRYARADRQARTPTTEARVVAAPVVVVIVPGVHSVVL